MRLHFDLFTSRFDHPLCFIARSTRHSISLLVPDQATSIPEIENGRVRLETSAFTWSPQAVDFQGQTPYGV